MADTLSRGRWGEEYAAARLVQAGYTILEHGYRSGHAEIDLIAQKGEIIAFVEVKLRRADALVTPAQSLSKAQRRRIVLAAVSYLKGRGIYNTGAVQPRFDLCEVETRPGSRIVTRYQHLAGAYDTGDLDVFI